MNHLPTTYQTGPGDRARPVVFASETVTEPIDQWPLVPVAEDTDDDEMET